METAVNGSGGELQREPIVDTNNQWTCPECKTVNPITEVDGDITIRMSACSECGAVRPDCADDDGPDLTSDELEEDVVANLALDDIKAGLSNLSGGIATAQDVENAARAEEGLPPLEAAGLLDFGPFNSDNALKAIFEKSAEVRGLQADYERKKELAKDAKSELDIASKALVNIIESLKNRRTQALNPSQPFLKDVSSDAPASSLSTSRCPWEREHPGQSCPICTAAQAKDLVPALESEVHPEHEGHAAIAEAARVVNVLDPLAAKLADVNLFITASDLQPLNTEDLNALASYADEPTPMPPHIVTRCCIAAEPGSLIQVCQRCERVLVEVVTDATAYEVGSLIGLQCGAATPVTEAAKSVTVAAAVEPTRTIKPRGSKKRAKKEPEQERAKQAEAGRRASDNKPKKSKKTVSRRGRK